MLCFCGRSRGRVFGQQQAQNIQHKFIVLQKKAVRAITQSKYNDHSSPLFRQLRILKCEDIHQCELVKFVFLVNNKSLPDPLHNIYNNNSQIHTYRTRQYKDMHIGKTRFDIAFRSFLHKGPHIWSSLPAEVKEAKTVKSIGSRFKTLIFNDY